MTTKLTDIFSLDNLNQAIADKFVNVRTNHDGYLIYNYSDAASYTKGSWDNPAVRACRGLITDADGNVAARAWAKFFNHNQPEADAIDVNLPVEVTDKADGSLGILFYNAAGDPQIATRGSFESEQAIHATAVLRELGFTWPSDLTVLTEIVFPDNRIVLNYGDFDGLILLGAVRIDSGEYIGANETAELIDWPETPRTRITTTFEANTMADALSMPPRPHAEGVVVRQGNRIVKIKQADYVALHRIVTGLCTRSVWEAMREDHTETGLANLLGPLPDELHDWTRAEWNAFDQTASARVDAARTVFESIKHITDRREFAAQAKQHKELTPLLFALLDGKDPYDLVLKTLRPYGNNRAVVQTEDNA